MKGTPNHGLPPPEFRHAFDQSVEHSARTRSCRGFVPGRPARAIQLATAVPWHCRTSPSRTIVSPGMDRCDGGEMFDQVRQASIALNSSRMESRVPPVLNLSRPPSGHAILTGQKTTDRRSRRRRRAARWRPRREQRQLIPPA